MVHKACIGRYYGHDIYSTGVVFLIWAGALKLTFCSYELAVAWARDHALPGAEVYRG